MKMELSNLTDELALITLDGRLDIDGARAIDDRFGFAVTTRKMNVIVDLAAVSFLASIGIRLLMSGARGQQARGGKLVLAAPQAGVLKVLEIAGIDQLISVYDDVESARAALSGA